MPMHKQVLLAWRCWNKLISYFSKRLCWLNVRASQFWSKLWNLVNQQHWKRWMIFMKDTILASNSLDLDLWIFFQIWFNWFLSVRHVILYQCSVFPFYIHFCPILFISRPSKVKTSLKCWIWAGLSASPPCWLQLLHTSSGGGEGGRGGPPVQGRAWLRLIKPGQLAWGRQAVVQF